MIDGTKIRVLVPDNNTGALYDRTESIEWVNPDNGIVRVQFKNGGQSFPYRHPRARLLENVSGFRSLKSTELVKVKGEVWYPPLTIATFTDVYDGSYSIVRFYRDNKVIGKSHLYRPDDLALLVSSASAGGGADVFKYWKETAFMLEDDDPTRPAFESIKFVHPDSALSAYMEGSNSRTSEIRLPIILPFQSNEDQKIAVERALSHRVSVIDGPPGTGKTETILNIIANILMIPGATVGVVSFGNAAVENVKDKLDEAGYGFVAARMGKKEYVTSFLADQEARASSIVRWLNQVSVNEAVRSAGGQAADDLEQIDKQLHRVWNSCRELAKVSNKIEEYSLEAAHLERRADGVVFPDLSELPLLRKSSGRILDYLAETTVHPDLPEGIMGLVPRIRRYFKYGRTKDLDTRDANIILGLERAFYSRRIEELRQKERRWRAEIGYRSSEEIRGKYQESSRALLDLALWQRYANSARLVFDEDNKPIWKHTPEFLSEYPVVLTTCHSIRRNLSEGHLLDWVIIDEATQTNLHAAALAMSKARNVVVVGDLKQLGPIFDKKLESASISPPLPAYDVTAHSILSSVTELYGQELPRTMLREHYRCAPEIIEFCNKMFYDGELISMKSRKSNDKWPALMVRKTAPGNHMRTLRRALTKGTYSQREIDLVEELLGGVVDGVDFRSILEGEDSGSDYALGVTSPYRLQADRLGEAINRTGAAPEFSSLSETIHKFQGRGANVMVLSTVVDESRNGHMKLGFVDDPRMINVAVSRAREKFILVTNHNEVPRSKVIKALIDYVRYQDPDQVTESGVLSVFDLLYQEYSERLSEFASRVHGGSKYKSENIVWTLLKDVLKDPAYDLLEVVSQVRLRDLMPDTDRLNERQKKFVRSTSAVDFAIYHKVSKRMLLAIEVNGTEYHEDNPEQQARDELKAQIISVYGADMLSLRTNDSNIESMIRGRLDQILA
ncbi:AAA domain-containing protein [Actinomyces naeslundii]|jgi:ATP-binding protein|uniref:AAA domain-containing protein n=1 Tax=Actinomyces naeslundii TaxID=1655 RepID=UPI0009D6AE91|nr:AAA domain-containing protein [Actinomyces naeslundii]